LKFLSAQTAADRRRGGDHHQVHAGGASLIADGNLGEPAMTLDLSHLVGPAKEQAFQDAKARIHLAVAV